MKGHLSYIGHTSLLSARPYLKGWTQSREHAQNRGKHLTLRGRTGHHLLDPEDQDNDFAKRSAEVIRERAKGHPFARSGSRCSFSCWMRGH
ncbi:hypothetical protein NPIL_35401 [Nephila pilipes]|uniref:Uncharacterized protein n=1 Tax=Nephila pilipes TaxID=299642 RepID=A0A8X6Q9K6_NEPPI|nr:hypothetical protein NPIL_35401 [Nephila pilipes]